VEREQLDQCCCRQEGLHQLSVARKGESRLQLAIDLGEKQEARWDRPVVQCSEPLDSLVVPDRGHA
jgi:hypothetical protein